MGACLTFEPLANSSNAFEPASIDLPEENKLYVIGFRENPAQTPGPTTANGFSDTLDGDKFCIAPIESEETKKMKDPFAVIWLAPGYKVMIIPAEGSRIYYQRAIENNLKWNRIKHGWGFDLSDPLLTALDGAIHVKFDTQPDERRARWYKRKLDKLIKRRKEKTYLVKHVHAGSLEGFEVHTTERKHQISARVTVDWGRNVEGEKEKWKRVPSKGDLRLESVRPEDAAKALKRIQEGAETKEVGKKSRKGEDSEEESDDDDYLFAGSDTSSISTTFSTDSEENSDAESVASSDSEDVQGVCLSSSTLSKSSDAGVGDNDSEPYTDDSDHEPSSQHPLKTPRPTDFKKDLSLGAVTAGAQSGDSDISIESKVTEDLDASSDSQDYTETSGSEYSQASEVPEGADEQSNSESNARKSNGNKVEKPSKLKK